MTRKRILSMLVLLVMAVTGAVAQEVTLLTTIESTGDNASFKSGSKTFDNIATVTFSGNVFNDNNEWGWFCNQERTLTVTAAEGYTITRVKFYTNEDSAFDEDAPFEAIVVEDNEDGNITKVNGTSLGNWGVTKIEVYGYAGTPAPTTYKVSVKEGTEDATSWTIAPPEATTTGVAQGTEVTATYSGTKKVKSVKAKKKAAAPAAAIAPALVDGATVVIEYNCDGFVTYFTFTNNGGTYSCNITGDESDCFSASLTKQGNTLVFVAHHSDIPDSFDSTINFDTTSDTYSFAKKTEELFYFKISVNGTDITDKLSEVQ